MKKWFKRVLMIGLCISMCVCTYAQARIIPQEEIIEAENKYYHSEKYDNKFMKINEIGVSSETGEITFLEAHSLNGTEEEVEFPDLVYVVDNNTDIGDTEENFEQFKNGKLTWANVCVSKEDMEKVYYEGVRSIHVKYLGWLNNELVLFPKDEKDIGRVLSEKGIMIGDETGMAPYRILTRAELAKMVVMLYNPELDESYYSDLSFTDVSEEHWAYKYIEYAANHLRVINGYEDGSFCPDAPATTEEAIKVFTCVLAVDGAGNLDYPDGYIKAAENGGLLNGVDVHFGHGIMRYEAAALAMNVLNIWGVVTE